MELQEAKQEFVQLWGTLGSNWGINKTMAQIHALLLISEEPLSTDEIMEQLQISRGNANMNVRTLIDWGMVRKTLKQGERREFFTSEKDVWELARIVARERKRREIDPLMKSLRQIEKVEGDGEQVENFKKMSREIIEFCETADGLLNRFIETDSNWFYKKIIKLLK